MEAEQRDPMNWISIGLVAAVAVLGGNLLLWLTLNRSELMRVYSGISLSISPKTVIVLGDAFYWGYLIYICSVVGKEPFVRNRRNAALINIACLVVAVLMNWLVMTSVLEPLVELMKSMGAGRR